MQLKSSPEDFRVSELPAHSWQESGTLWVYKLTKRNCTTTDAIRQLATENGLATKHIRFAGMKDKLAVTQQFISSAQELSTKDDRLSLEFAGHTDEHLFLGDLAGNRFEIIARGVQEVRDVAIPNYFGEQRFSTRNVELGLHILRGQWLEVAEKLAPEFAKVKQALEQNPQAPVHAVRQVPFHILLLFVHAVQSMLFNKVVSAFVKQTCNATVSADSSCGPLYYPEKLPDAVVPLMGAAQELGTWEKYYTPLLEELQLTPADFVVRTIPGLTMEGTERALRCDVQDKSVELDGDVATVKMSLPPGSYATICCSGWLV